MQQATIATAPNTGDKLDPREQHFHIPGPIEGLRLFLRYLPPHDAGRGTRKRIASTCMAARSPPRCRSPIASMASPGVTPCALPVSTPGASISMASARCRMRIPRWPIRPARIRRSVGWTVPAGSSKHAIRFICNHHARAAHLADRAFLGHDGCRASRRTLPGPDRAHGLLRRHRAAPGDDRRPRDCRHGGSYRSRTNGTVSSPTFLRTSSPCCHGGISMIGASAISTPIRSAARGVPPR